MTSLEIVGIVAIILFSCFSLVGIAVSIPLIKLINRTKFLVSEVNKNLLPIVERLKTTINNLNTEISSVVDITQSVSSIIEQLEKLVRLARLLITNPIIKTISTVVGIIEGVKKVASEEKEGSKK